MRIFRLLGSGPAPGELDQFAWIERNMQAIERYLIGITKELGLNGIQLFTASDTYTPTAGTTAALVMVQAAGGGGGGVGTTVGTGRAGHGGPGEARWAVVAISGNVTVTIGAEGTGGAAGANDGIDAADTTFGALITAKGGTKGGASDGSNNGTNGTVPAGGSGGIVIPPTFSATNTASSFWGSNGTIFGAPWNVAPAPTAINGPAGRGHGAGGAGGVDNTTSARAGGNGALAMVVVIEFKK